MASTLFIVAITVLAIARITRFVTQDKLSQPFRMWLLGKMTADSLVVYAFHCRWCFGMYVSMVAVPIVWFLTPLGANVGLNPWIGIPALTFAASHVTGLLVKLEATE